MAASGATDCRSVFAPTNAVSHWIWKDRAIHRDEASLRYTATGYAIHHLASVFWGTLFESLKPTIRARSSRERAVDAATVAAVAAVVDLKCTPERLTPGFERRLSTPALVAVYVAFGLGLYLCSRDDVDRDQ
jgi:hypothetical protein